ncbi:SusD/RagB family nutrient-binding outer membrane lipoprotein [Desulfosarcina sp.]|nr:SusD/RagB family nutrient-binding outer membrane lipoprotein [Desulfosarcina sp.]
MKKIFKIKVVLVLALIFSFLSCTKDWEEMNTNPNEPTVVPATNVLVYSLRYYCDNFVDEWMNMNNISTYAGHITKIQYIDESRYLERESVINDAWRDMYTTLLQLNKAKILAADEGNTVLVGAAMTFQAFMLHRATDLWKNIPWSNAMQGEDEVSSPTYDTQESIYFAILEQLRQANELLATGEGEMGEGDILFYGDVVKWQKFCNSLRLRLAIRMSFVLPVEAQSIVEEILGDPGQFPIMESNDDNAFFYWPGLLPYMEPWAEDQISENRDDHGMCETLVDTLLAFNDPRLPVYAHRSTSDSVYRGLDAGAVDGSFALSDISRIGARFRDTEAGFSPLMRYSELLFIIAEAAKNGWSTGISAQAAYEAGVIASLEENEVASGDITTYLADPKVTWNDSYTQIYIQKWICLFKQGHEAWAETRRTDVPLMPAATDALYSGHNRPPFRFKYPTRESNLNGANLTQNLGGIIDHFWGNDNGKMWWDTRTGVN